MAAIVVPFRGVDGKRRLAQLPPDVHARLVLAMLADVVAAACDVARTVVVTSDGDGRRVARDGGAEVVDDPGGGQSAAVARALGALAADRVVILNADIPCVTASDIRSLLAATRRGGIALVRSRDGRTNALSLPAPELFQPLYGPRSASRFERAAQALGLEAVTVALA